MKFGKDASGDFNWYKSRCLFKGEHHNIIPITGNAVLFKSKGYYTIYDTKLGKYLITLGHHNSINDHWRLLKTSDPYQIILVFEDRNEIQTVLIDLQTGDQRQLFTLPSLTY